MVKIRVCHVITRLIHGGAQENTLLTVNGLDPKRYEVTLVGGPPLGRRGGILHRVHARVHVMIIPQMRRAVNPVADFIAFWKLYRLFRRANFAIVHTHSTQAGIYGRLAARLAGVPHIIHTVHGLAFHAQLNPFARAIAWTGEKMASSFTEKIICVSDAMVVQSLKGHIAPREKFITIRSGFDTAKFVKARPSRTFRASYRIPNDEILVAQIGGLVPLKGCEDFVRAAALVHQQFPNAHFTFIGDGELQDALRKQVECAGLQQRFHFVGMVAAEDLPAVLASIDIVAHCSLREGLPRVVAQALAARKACVAVDMDGTQEIIRHGRTGLLVPARQPQKIADSICRLIGDPRLRIQLGNAGQKAVRIAFDQKLMIKKISAVYEELLQ